MKYVNVRLSACVCLDIWLFVFRQTLNGENGNFFFLSPSFFLLFSGILNTITEYGDITICIYGLIRWRVLCYYGRCFPLCSVCCVVCESATRCVCVVRHFNRIYSNAELFL